uniref:Serpin domain-containing protein n=1 Tax=Stomoxys calcitrans TaxID=35570 RepID=A0A1I8PTH2_STOCA
MANHQHQSGNNVTRVLLTFYIGAFLSPPGRSSMSCSAHLIHIADEHHEFRSSVLGRPHLPPPLPPPPPPPLSPPQMTHIPGRELTPAECMVDLTNDLAYRILHYHSILNRNNFAFSPTALMSVLVALYEGSTGRSATELKSVLQLPNNRDIVRVGYRDIHRRLRTYFFGSDNPLKGLSLNKENVTITRDFEAILMFYGYDLGVDMMSSTSPPPTTTAAAMTPTSTTPAAAIATTMTSSAKISTATTTTTATPTTTTPTLSTTTAKIETDTTTTTKASTTQDTTTMTEVLTTTTPTATTTMTPATTSTTTTMETTTNEQVTTTTLPTIATTYPVTSDTVETSTEITQPLTEAVITTTTPAEDTTTETTTVPPTAATANEAAELISSFVAEENSEPFSRIQQARVTRLPNSKLQAPRLAKVPQSNYLPSQRNSKHLRINRRKRHLSGFKDFDSNLFVGLLNGESYLHNLAPVAGLHTPPSGAHVQVSQEFEVDTDPNYFNSSPSASKQNYNTDVITHVFYLSNQQVIYTTFKVYNAVLYYKYFERLRMSVLELELDTPNYNLIILLPDYNTDLVAAAASLRSGPKLRFIRKQLRPKWVQAIIPDFKLQGTMFLTNDLQNLGVYDIFEPNRADFRPMTDESGTYVKHIEQSINVHIRTHPINQLRRNAGAQAQPTQISVNHPFMFFVIDRDLDVAVMTGRILNPLNVRIQ